MRIQTRIKTKKQFLEIYEKGAASYDRERSSSFTGKVVDDLQQGLIYEALKKNKCKKILEGGCGTGRILIYLAEKNFECYGIDPSENMLKECRKKSKKLKIKLKKGDIEKIPFKDNTFDGTYTMHVIMHMPDYKKAFKEMHRVTKKDGIIICDFPNKNSPWTKLSIWLSPKKKRTQLFTIEELKTHFKKFDYEMTGLLSYARSFYMIPVLRHIVLFLEKYLPLPLNWRTQLIVIVKK